MVLDSSLDLESNDHGNAFLRNSTVRNFAWRELIVTVKDRETKQMMDLLCGVSGYATQGTFHHVKLWLVWLSRFYKNHNKIKITLLVQENLWH